jgi:flagellar basal-body rod modification protein FlgD
MIIQPDAATTAAPRRTAAITSDFTTFLKMLTTQMQNQDPLNPIDSADYAVQLATFSGVEQQVRTNDLIQQMQMQFGLLGMAELSGWVGQEARVTAPVWRGEGQVSLVLDPAAGADRAVLVVRDSSGQTVARDPVSPTTERMVWAGLAADGTPLPQGRYTLTLESWAGERQLAATPVEHFARITETRNTPEGVVVLLQGGVEVPATAIAGLRESP